MGPRLREPAGWTAVLAVTVALTGSVRAEPELQAERVARSSVGWKDGAEVYAKACAHCHETGVGPALRGRGLPAVYFQVTARLGRGAMPAFRTAEIDDAALAQLGEYLAKQ